jgi:O-antigen/teichoic acid export membrane protein
MHGSTLDLAQVAALGRIAQLFAVLTIFNVIVIEPYVARLSRERVAGNFFLIFFIGCAGCVPLVLLAFWRPQAYLWLLGRKYTNLYPYMGWLILGNCINFMAGVLWVLNRARKWIFWSGTAVEIVLVLAVQGVFLALVGVRTVHQAVMFTFACSFCYLAAHGYVTFYGLSRPNPATNEPQK